MENPRQLRIFVGPNGIRAGWRVLLFAAIFAGLLYGKLRLYGVLHVHVPSPGETVNLPPSAESSSVENTGSESKRGIQHQTTSPVLAMIAEY